MQDVIYNANKQEWDRLGKASLKLGAYGAGIPYSQPKRTISGVIDLAANKSDDWMRLMYSEYARKKATGETGTTPTRTRPVRRR